MDWIQGIQRAIDHIEDHITEKIDYEDLARVAYSSGYHFQRVFGIVCGMTLGEYIRKRRLTLAGGELSAGRKVTDVAFKYGYDTPESFSRAFMRFHGVKPSQVKKGCSLKSFSRLTLKTDLTGGNEMKYEIKEMPEKILVGYKRRFTGVPYGDERTKQEEEFVTTTRAKQWLLIGASCDYSTDYCVIANVDDDGYDFYIAYELDEQTRENLYDPKVTGVDFIDKMGFETVIVPRATYAVFATEKKKRAVCDYTDLRKKIASEWLPSSDHSLAKSPEVAIMHWRPKGEWAKERYIEICLPIEIKK